MQRIVIIGGGIVGCFLAHDLSKYEVDVTLIERHADICEEVSAANSAIVHTGYDPEDGTLKAKLNVRGARMYPRICKAIHADYQQCGAYVVACNKEEEQILYQLKERGLRRGIRMEMISQEELRKEEVNLSQDVTLGLSVPETAIITPWEVGWGCMQEAIVNGVQLKLSQTVLNIQKCTHGYRVITNQETIETDFIINAAGLGAQSIMEMVEDTSLFTCHPKRGQYFVLDQKEKDVVHHILYPTPTAQGKGVLCVPTCHGNVLLGPNSEPIEEIDTSTTASGLHEVKEKLEKTLQHVPYHHVIHSYSGIRPCGNHNDFFIQASPKDANIIHLGCIDSPGLASAPAISEYVIETLLPPFMKKHTYTSMRLPIRMKDLKEEEQQAYITNIPAYGHIVCRCEKISEQEIVNCIHTPCGARSIKGVKKRVRPGMGKCQGGFCEVEVAKILARELQIPLDEVVYDEEAYYETSKGGQV